MAINYKKVLCSSVLGAFLFCANANAATLNVTNNSDTDLTLQVQAADGRVLSDGTLEQPLKAHATAQVTVAKESVGADTFLVTAKGGVMPNGKCEKLWVSKNYDISFDAGKANTGTVCTSKESSQ